MPETKCKLQISPCSHEAASYAVLNWHYSRAMPASKLIKYGAWENDKFIGAVLFGRGACSKLVSRYGFTMTEGCELVRVALKSHETPVSRIVAICLKILKRENPGLRLVVSFADTAQGHDGGIYKAGNWVYTGATNPDKFPILGGKMVHTRTFSQMVKMGKIKRSDVKYKVTLPKHRYLYPLDAECRTAIEKFRRPYPKRPTDEVVSCTASSRDSAVRFRP